MIIDIDFKCHPCRVREILRSSHVDKERWSLERLKSMMIIRNVGQRIGVGKEGMKREKRRREEEKKKSIEEKRNEEKKRGKE